MNPTTQPNFLWFNKCLILYINIVYLHRILQELKCVSSVTARVGKKKVAFFLTRQEIFQMASIATVKILCWVLVGMVVVAPNSEAAISCGSVANTLAPCLNYVLNGGAVPAACCNGISSLYNSLKTTPDRQTVCSCLKSVAGSASPTNFKNAAGLPSKCGLNIPYKITPSIDCSK